MSDKFVAWRNDYNAEKYDRYSLMLPKGMKETLKVHASTHGYKSLNDFINSAIAAQIDRDNGAEGNNPEPDLDVAERKPNDDAEGGSANE